MAALSFASAIGVGGCGSEDSTTAAGSAASTAAAVAPAQGPKHHAGGAPTARRVAKKPGTPQARRIRHSFPPPRTEGLEPEAVSAVEAGEAACAGKTPTAVKEEFYAEAEGNLDPEQAKMIGQIGKFEAKGAADQSFVAGQLAADTYAATLAEESAHEGFEGCVYALAQGLERQSKKK